MKLPRLGVLTTIYVVAALAAGCGGPAATSPAATATTIIVATPVSTPTPSPVVQVNTVSLGTAAPTTPNPQPLNTPTSALIVDLKYLLLNRFGDVFFCDPDSYPVARDESTSANERFPSIQQDAPTFEAILKHLNLNAGIRDFDAGQKLAVYREYKRLNAVSLQPSGNAYAFSLRTPGKQPNPRDGMAVSGTISRQGEVTVTSSQPAILQCPICLAVDTMIDGPNGPVAVQDLRVGDWVWTMDHAGVRVAAPVALIASAAVSQSHVMVRLRFQDGGELIVSPRHPTADGQLAGDLRVGDQVAGRVIADANREGYAGGFTYDLLPAGETGFYWANGVLMASTLK